MQSITSDRRSIREVYVDESSQTKHRYLILGAVALPLSESPGFVEQIAQCRLPELPAGEMAWVKVSRTKLDAYIRVVDLFFASSYAHFHAAVIDTSKLDHHFFNAGDREVGFNKEIYQLVQKCGRLYRNDVFHVYLDKRESPQPAEKLRTILNFGARARDLRPWPYRRVQFRDSVTSPVIQLTDILTGAIAFRLNGHSVAPGASPAKLHLSNLVLEKARVNNPFADTSIAGKFTIWHRRLKVRPAVLDR